MAGRRAKRAGYPVEYRLDGPAPVGDEVEGGDPCPLVVKAETTRSRPPGDLAARLVDELELHIVPLVLGGDARLFDGLAPDLKLGQARAIEAPGVTHLKYRVVK